MEELLNLRSSANIVSMIRPIIEISGSYGPQEFEVITPQMRKVTGRSKWVASANINVTKKL
jgi:hypothetical protein